MYKDMNPTQWDMDVLERNLAQAGAGAVVNVDHRCFKGIGLRDEDRTTDFKALREQEGHNGSN